MDHALTRPIELHSVSDGDAVPDTALGPEHPFLPGPQGVGDETFTFQTPLLPEFWL